MIVPLTPLDFLARARTYFGHRVGVIAGERRRTYAEFGADVARLAGLLAGRGTARGDRVAWLGPNSYELLCAYYAVPSLGAVLVPLNTRLATGELEWIAGDCAPTVLMRDPAHDPVPGSHHDLVIDESMAAEWLDTAPAPRVEVDENDPAEIFYTSGSTGRPKGVVWTHRALYLHAVHSAVTTGFRPDDVFCTTIPLFHVNGWGVPHYATGLGAQQVVLPFTADGVLDAIDTHGVTRLFLVPTMARALLESPRLTSIDTSSVRGISVGGAPVSAELLHEMEAAFDAEAICGYGLTETSTFTRSHPLPGTRATTETKLTIGMPILGADVRVVDDDGADVPWDAETIGEILARSNHVADGYWNAPELTDEVIVDGWFHTGDLATVDPAGYLRIVDRKKDLIISGGENIASVEIERVIALHPAVAEVAVVGRPDPRWGEVPRAWVELVDGVTAGPDDILAWAAGHLARYKLPREVFIVPELPKGGTGKVQKPVLRDWDPPG